MPQFKFYEEIRKYEKLDCDEERRKKAREIYDTFIMRELLSNSNLYSKASAEHVQKQLAVKPTQATEVSMSFLTFLLFSSVGSVHINHAHNSPIYDECQTQQAKVLTLP